MPGPTIPRMEQSAKTLVEYVRKQALRPVPLTWVGCLFVAAFLIIGAALFRDFPIRPIPGLAIGLLGAGAVVVAVRTDHLTLVEKIGWILVAFLLFGVEIRAIYKDRAQQDENFAAARRAEARNFEHIANGITKAIEENERNFNAVMGSTNTLLSSNLGGNSFCFTTLEPGILGWKNQAVFQFTHRGKYPLYDVSAQLMDQRKMKQLMKGLGKGQGIILAGALPAETHIMVGDLPVGTTNIMWNRAIPLGDHEELSWHIIFAARNGTWREDLRASFVKDKWVQALRVYRMIKDKKGQNLLGEVDPDYPRGEHGQVDWDRVP